MENLLKKTKFYLLGMMLSLFLLPQTSYSQFTCPGFTIHNQSLTCDIVAVYELPTTNACVSFLCASTVTITAGSVHTIPAGCCGIDAFVCVAGVPCASCPNGIDPVINIQ